MINTSSTLFRYISRQFLFNLLVLMTILLGLFLIFELIETFRKSANTQELPFDTILTMSLLRLPFLGEQVLAIGILFAAIFTCWRLNKTSELVVIRSAGLSAWQFLSPLLICGLLLGIFSTAILNPVSATFISKNEEMQQLYFKSKMNLVAVSRTGIWLRQPVDTGYAIIHSATFDQKNWQLNDVIVFYFDSNDNFTKRIDADKAFLKEGFWDIEDPLVNDKQGRSKSDNRLIPTELTADKIEESFADPETISFWRIPEYINIMEQTGFPATKLYIHFHALLAKPFLFAAMILLAAACSLRPPRFGGAGALVVLGIMVGFAFFFLESMLQAFGISQKIPVFLAAWSPAVIALLFGGAALLHLEDG